MSYQVLARKWRPQNFEELVGQEHVSRALVNALNDDRLHHAYLFTGTRGVGKTTIARIFAKSLNCEQGISATPCGKCGTCLEIAEGRYVDLIEVDAASRTGVDDTRDLLENVQYAPTRGRYKVYLIDEVHMFSKSSFNALLKTLEEPPPHVKFLLATTDPQKLPVTILSRCLQFNLKRLSVGLIIDHLSHILSDEKVAFDETALQLIAEAADGSMRDGLSLLDQALAFGGGNLKEQEVRDMLGSVSRDKVIRLLSVVLQRDAPATMKVVAELAELSPDFESVLAELLSLLHHMSLAKLVPEALDDYVSAREVLLDLSQQVSAEDIQLFYQIALIGRKDLPLSPDARSGFEMVLLRMLAFRPGSTDSVSTQSDHAQTQKTVTDNCRLSPAEKAKQAVGKAKVTIAERGGNNALRDTDSDTVRISTNSAVADSVIKDSVVKDAPVTDAGVNSVDTIDDNASAASSVDASVQSGQAKNDKAGTEESWRQIIEQLALGGLVKQLAVNCMLKQREGNKIVLQIASGHGNLIHPKAKQRLQQALGEYFNIDAQLHIEMADRIEEESPAQAVQREIVQRQQQAEQSVEEDSFVRSLKDNFNAELIPGSVKPVS